MSADKTTFALYLGNRGMFPGSLMASARAEITDLLTKWGHEVICLDETATRYGAIETPEEGRIFANFLDANKGKVGGVFMTLPNFGDENGALAALKHTGLPIFIHAYPDDLDKMAPELRRDAFCGKFSIMDVFWQSNIKYTIAQPHTLSPQCPRFKQNVEYFDSVCRVVGGMKDMTLGAIGARTTAFKTVRFDEVTLQKHGITVESFDLSQVFHAMADLDENAQSLKDKVARLKDYTCWTGVPEDRLVQIARLGVVLDDLIEEYSLDCIALRCWVELQSQMGISPCVLLSEINDRGIAASCEVDVGNAVAMQALSLASGQPVTCLDWNNNYGDDDDKCILFHCGPVPKSLMSTPGRIVDHEILKNVVGEGCAYGCNVGRIAAMPFTFASSLTAYGKIKFYLGEGEFTPDPIAEDFFGCAGVAHIDKLQDVLTYVGRNGFRHHVSCGPGNYQAAILEALDNYLGYDVAIPQG